MNPRTLTLSALFVLTISPCALADDTDSIELEPVIITASRVELPASAIPGTVTVLEREDIDTQQLLADDLASVLENNVPGFGPSLRKMTGRAESLRGRNPLYLVDGVPQHNALRDGQRDGHFIDLDFIERIEVINGSNAIQGVGATGGVIQLVTRSPSRSGAWESHVNSRLTAPDDFDSDGIGYKLSAIAGRSLKDIDFMFGASLHDQGLLFDANGDPVGLYPTQGDTMDSQAVGLFLKGRWHISAVAELSLMVNDYDIERNGDFLPVPGNRAQGVLSGTAAGDPSPLVGDPARNETTTVNLTYRHSDLLQGIFSAQLFDQSFEGRFEGGEFGGFYRLTPDGPPFLDQSAVVSDKQGLKLTWSRPLDQRRSNLALGLDFFRDDSSQVLTRSDREWVPDTRFETWAPFAQVNWAVLDSLTLVGGLRYEDATLEVDDYTTIASSNSTFVRGGSPDFSETLVNGGLIWKFAEHWNLYVAYNEGFTMPDVGRVLRAVNTPGKNVDSLLTVSPIVTDNREIGIEFNNGPLRAHLAVYDSSADEGSILRLNAEGIFEVERERTEIEGIEFSLEYMLSDYWSLGGNYTYLDGRFDADDDGSVESDLDGLNIAPNRLNAYLQGSFGEQLDLRVQASWFDDRSFEGPGAPDNADFDGYTLFDAVLRWNTNYGRLGLGIENLFNKQYVIYFSQVEPGQRNDTFFAGAGRTLSLSWQASF